MGKAWLVYLLSLNAYRDTRAFVANREKEKATE
ncbi:hypothetical protein ERO13_D05G321350v2 [Gossypium hirsutum]|uniref:Uncharacterized protein n=1 Tax=Gossypium darwinii TaxID=34276 RepID=A0A5D2CSA2_GOSDA|nr:hypothetical protein ERO13_D05G321350v2 [Gossypium hirsutum]TYG71062.1 hypothetical protein ES288_D05G364600v1 [Gossypium darwinii]